MDGGADRNRTCDLLIANETLYQLSYDPIQDSNERALLCRIAGEGQAQTTKCGKLIWTAPGTVLRVEVRTFKLSPYGPLRRSGFGLFGLCGPDK